MIVKACVSGVTLTAELIFLGEDLCVAVTGGDRPHLGCAALALPHPGITKPAIPSATVSTLHLPGHRDDQLANRMAKALSAALSHPVAVLCGVHFDQFSQQVLSDAEQAADVLCNEILRLLAQ